MCSCAAGPVLTEQDRLSCHVRAIMGSMTQRVFVDANVLFSKTRMDWLFLLRLRNEGMFQVHATEDVLAETIANMRERHPTYDGSYTRHRLELIRKNLDEVIEDYPANGAEGSVPFTGSDPHDYHVHAAASAGRADIILTCNKPDDITQNPENESYEIMHPDDFYCLVVTSNPHCLIPIIKEQLAYWSKHNSRRQLDDMLRPECPSFADCVRDGLRTIARQGYA